jgi:hypothetical protein
MTDKRPTDPFAKLSSLSTDQKLFSSHTIYKGAAREKEHPKSPAQNPTSKVTWRRDTPRGQPREVSSGSPREDSRNLPSRDEIQEFSFSLRDELRVKVQAEVPHQWQKELDDIARELNVKKLELYRFILGEFLGKVRRKKAA